MSICIFTRTAEILASLLAKFYCQSISGQTHEFITYVIIYSKKQIDVRFSCVCPVIDNEFRHNILAIPALSRLH